MLKQSWLLHVINWLLSIYDTSLYSSNKAYLTYCYKYFISLWVKVIFSILCHIFFNRKYHQEAAITLVYFGLHYSAHVRYWWCVISSGKSRGCHVDWWLADPLWVCLETILYSVFYSCFWGDRHVTLEGSTQNQNKTFFNALHTS